jgi:hypothetical protein
VAGAGSVHGVVVPVGVEVDEVEGDGGEHVLEVDFAQAPVAGVADAGDREGLVDGAFDAGAQGVGGESGKNWGRQATSTADLWVWCWRTGSRAALLRAPGLGDRACW